MREKCPECGYTMPVPCPCWRDKLTPNQRQAAQSALVQSWFDRRATEARQKAIVQRGQFGNRKAGGQRKKENVCDESSSVWRAS